MHVTAVDSARYAHTFARTYIETDAAATDVARAAGGRRPTSNELPGTAGLRHRDLQPSGPLLPTAQRRSDRCRARRHRLGVCGVTPVPPPVDVPHRGGGPRRLDHRRADGLREAVGAPLVQAAGAAGAGAAGGAGPRHPGRRGGVRPADLGTSTWRTWTRRTTSTGISPTTTCGRRWWPGTRPRPTAWPASGSMPVTHPRTRCSTPSSTMPGGAGVGGAIASTATCSCCPTTTSRGWRWTSSRRCAPSRGEVATLAFDSARYVGARIGIFDPSGRKVGRVSHLSNQELLVIAGEPALVRRVVEAAGSHRRCTASGSPPSLVDRLQQAT